MAKKGFFVIQELTIFLIFTLLFSTVAKPASAFYDVDLIHKNQTVDFVEKSGIITFLPESYENPVKRYVVFGSGPISDVRSIAHNLIYDTISKNGFFSVGVFSQNDVLNLKSKGYTVIEDFPLEFDSLKSNIRIKIREKFLNNWKMLFRAEDEIDLLVNKFNAMIERLEKTYDELRLTQISLVQSEKLASIGTLAAGIAHEMNNPLSGLQNCIKRISKNPENLLQNKKYLNLMMEASDRIERVIQNLMNYSRHQELKFEKVNIITIIENSLLLVSHKLEKSKITVERDYTTSIKEIEVSPIHIEQVIINIILNSVDAINDLEKINENALAKIYFKIRKSEESKINIEIEDTGKGMHQEELKKIFDPFYTSKDTGKGTGLGLSVSYNIIDLHKGTISVESTPDIGTKFIISLPIKQI
ncbi:MAG: hypothetical protein D4R72_07150 [Nitrosopumilales archaeon]|nr:MAG: hypothetical protein D4R72_07150 [Nitrosopumilales archaeon]